MYIVHPVDLCIYNYYSVYCNLVDIIFRKELHKDLFSPNVSATTR